VSAADIAKVVEGPRLESNATVVNMERSARRMQEGLSLLGEVQVVVTMEQISGSGGQVSASGQPRTGEGECGKIGATGSGPTRHGETGIRLADQQVIGKVGRVTGTIGPDQVGEVMIAIRGGSEAFNAYAADTTDTISTGTRVVVIEYFPPRTVVVSPM
jgi:hypothetical protein